MAYIFCFGLEIESEKDVLPIKEWWDNNNNIHYPNGDIVSFDFSFNQDDTGNWICIMPVNKENRPKYPSGSPTCTNDKIELNHIRNEFYSRLKSLSIFRIASGDFEAYSFNTYDGLLEIDWNKDNTNMIVSNEFYENCKGKENFLKFSETHYWIPNNEF